MATEMTYFADKVPNKLAENRSALSAPDREQRGQSVFDWRLQANALIDLWVVLRFQEWSP